MADLDVLIVNILRQANTPLNAPAIVQLLARQHGVFVEKTDVNRCLYGSLSTLVSKDSQTRWFLQGKTPKGDLAPVVPVSVRSRKTARTRPPSPPRPQQQTLPDAKGNRRKDLDDRYRPILLADRPPFLHTVNTPWDQVPDLKEYNQHAYKRIVWALDELSPSRNKHLQSK
jgi:hypothetical protein